MTDHCPLCASRDLRPIYRRSPLPIFQNRVYPSAEAARKAACGELQLMECASCAFVFNAAFDPALVRYDPGYDNHVESKAFDAYYQTLAKTLGSYIGAGPSTVVEVGCGDGRFLRKLRETAPSGRYLGFDPALREEVCEPGFALSRSLFNESSGVGGVDWLICRHTLEHVPKPLAFTRQILSGCGASTQIFFEVPDWTWIVKQKATWDLFYEHCNYFGPHALAYCMTAAGVDIKEMTSSFGDQYLWCSGRYEGAITSATARRPPLSERPAADLHTDLMRLQEVVRAWTSQGYALAIWGMASKGVTFTETLDLAGIAPRFTVDKNPRKQGCYTPRLGLKIEAPEVLSRRRAAVVCMNPNYAQEIREELSALEADHVLLSPELKLIESPASSDLRS